MFILYGVLIGLLLGVAFGGHPSRLESIRFRGAWVAMSGLGFQLVLFAPVVTERIGDLGPPLYVGSTIVVLIAVMANWRITGVPLVIVGALLNLLAIVSNGGYMPASAQAAASLGDPRVGYSNSAVLPSANLAFLGDIFAMPGWIPLANVFSIGDVLIGLGVAVALVVAMRRPATTTGTQPA